MELFLLQLALALALLAALGVHALVRHLRDASLSQPPPASSRAGAIPRDVERDASALHGRNRVVRFYRKSGVDYRFAFERLASADWRIYILEQPDYGSRDRSLHATHRLRDGTRFYVCWTATIPTLAAAMKVAALWAAATDAYIRRGTRF